MTMQYLLLSSSLLSSASIYLVSKAMVKPSSSFLSSKSLHVLGTCKCRVKTWFRDPC